MITESFSREDTLQIAYQMAQNAQPGQVYALIGDLGVGKTVFVKGIARGLGIKEPVVSPTFTILQEYKDGQIPLYHFDVYRIEDEEEMFEIGFDDYLYGDGVCLIEWAENVKGLLPKDAVSITIEKDPEQGLSYRRITIE